MRLLTLDDITDTYTKLRQRGLPFILSKFSIQSIQRTKSAFNELNIQSSNWWIIPKIKERWNYLITGNTDIQYEDFLMQTYLKNSKKLRMLSLGSGICSHELKLASYDNFEKIVCIDINEVLFDSARALAQQNNLTNIEFIIQDIYTYDFPENHFDIVFFHASLHHFKNIDHLINNTIRRTLKKQGQLIINEYVGPNRLQFPKHQLKAINKGLQLIPKHYRKRFKLNIYKNKVYGSGILRMILADPSECIESSNIVPAIKRKYYSTVYEAPYGGNILANVLKDISHHFIELDTEKEEILKQLFEFENTYIKNYPSDFIFGIYQVNNKTM